MNEQESEALRARLRAVIQAMDTGELLEMVLPQNSIRAKIAAWLRPYIRQLGWHAVVKDGKLKPGRVRRAYLKWYHATRTPELLRTNKSITHEEVTALALEQAGEVLGIKYFGKYLNH